MEPLDPQLAAVFAATTGVGFLMLVSGLQKSVLERRRTPRPCPACGRMVETRVCRACAAD